MSVRNTNFFRVILILFIALSSPICFLSGINDFQEVHFKNGKVGSEAIQTVITKNPNAVRRHLQGLKYGTFINSKDSSQRAIMLWAAKYNRLEAINNILTIAFDENDPVLDGDFESSINYQDPDTGKTPLHEAIINKNLQIVQLLLKNKSDQFVANKFGNTPLHEAVIANSLPMVQELINDLKQEYQREFIEVKNKLNKTALDLAFKASDVEKYLSQIVNLGIVEEKKEGINDKHIHGLAEKAQKLGEEKAKINEEKIDTEKTAGPRLNVTTRPQGFPGRRLPTKKLDVARKLRSEQLQEEMQKRDEEAQEKRKSVIANLKKFKIELDDFVIKNPKKPLTKVSLQALLKQNNLEKYFTELNMLSDSTVTVAKFHEAIDKKIEKLNKKMGIYEAEVILSLGVQKDLSEGLIESKSDGKLEQQLKKLSASLGILRSKLDELRKSLNDLKSHLH